MDEDLITLPAGDRGSTLTPLLELRVIFVPPVPETDRLPPLLQQAWRVRETGEIVWRTVDRVPVTTPEYYAAADPERWP